jgi:hypothetical protein
LNRSFGEPEGRFFVPFSAAAAEGKNAAVCVETASLSNGITEKHKQRMVK